MSKTMLTTEDVPKYIREIAARLRPVVGSDEKDVPGYTFFLYGRHKVGYEDQLSSDCEKLLAWSRRYHADAYVSSEHFWWTDVPAPNRYGLLGDRSHRRKAYELGYRNYIKIVITDPVAHRFEKDHFYSIEKSHNKSEAGEKRDSLDAIIASASSRTATSRISTTKVPEHERV